MTTARDSIAPCVEEAIQAQCPDATDRDKAAVCIALAVFYAQESEVPYTREEFVRDMGKAWDYGVQLDAVGPVQAAIDGALSDKASGPS